MEGEIREREVTRKQVIGILKRVMNGRLLSMETKRAVAYGGFCH